MKREYYVKWRNQVVGEITNENGNRVYVPNMKNIDKLKKEGMPSILVDKTKDGRIPVFIEKRLKQKIASTATDDFSIVKP